MSIALARVGHVAAPRVQTAHAACESVTVAATRRCGAWTRLSTRRLLSSDESIPQPGPLPGTLAAVRLVYDAHGQPLDVLRLEGYRVRAAPPRGNVLVTMLAAPINPADINQVTICAWHICVMLFRCVLFKAHMERMRFMLGVMSTCVNLLSWPDVINEYKTITTLRWSKTSPLKTVMRLSLVSAVLRGRRGMNKYPKIIEHIMNLALVVIHAHSLARACDLCQRARENHGRHSNARDTLIT